jgi:hypothetical protein
VLAQSLAAQGSRQGVLNLHGCSVNVLMEVGWGRAAEKRDKARRGEREEEGATHGCELATWAQGLGRLEKTCPGGQRTSGGCASGWATCPRSDVRDALQVGARWTAGQASQAAARWAAGGNGPRARWAAGRRLGAGRSQRGPSRKKPSWALGKRRGRRRGQLGRRERGGGGLREFSFYLFLFLSFSPFENMF